MPAEDKRAATRGPIVVSATAALTGINVIAAFIELGLVIGNYKQNEVTDYLVPQDIWFPFMVALVAQALVNGVLLTLWPRTRLIGVGILVGSVIAIAVFFVFLSLLFASIGS